MHLISAATIAITWFILATTVKDAAGFSSLPNVVTMKKSSFRLKTPLFLHQNNNNNDYDDEDTIQTEQEQLNTKRRSILQKALLLTTTTPLFLPHITNAFDGGVGGLGKTKPEMGIIFVNPDDISTPTSGNGEIVTNELISPKAGVPVLVSFEAPWPTLRSSSNIESRDLANPEAAFVQVASLSSGQKSVTKGGDVVLKKEFFEETVFGSKGKYGAYGSPTDIKVKRLPPSSPSTTTTTPNSPTIYSITFTTLTPAMRESERKVYISTYIINDQDVFMLVVGSTYNRFEKRESLLRRVAESFSVVEAPKSSLKKFNTKKIVMEEEDDE